MPFNYIYLHCLIYRFTECLYTQSGVVVLNKPPLMSGTRQGLAAVPLLSGVLFQVFLVE